MFWQQGIRIQNVTQNLIWHLFNNGDEIQICKDSKMTNVRNTEAKFLASDVNF